MKKTTAQKINNIKKIKGENYNRKLCVSYTHYIEEFNSAKNENISYIRFKDDSVLRFDAIKETTQAI